MIFFPCTINDVKLDNFVSDHVVKKMFTRWKDVHKEKEVEKNQTERALWFWSVNFIIHFLNTFDSF